MKEDSKYLIIKKYFHTPCSNRLRNKFVQWLLNPDSIKEKEDILYKIWEEEVVKDEDTSIFDDLASLHKKMGLIK